MSEMFAEFKHNPWLELMLTVKGWEGGFSQSDKDALIHGLNVIRTAMIQPVGTSCAYRVEGAVSDAEYSHAVLSVITCSMALWLSGKLFDVDCDSDDD